MKKMTKKVVIATTTGLASMILNAACGYGPPVQEQYVEPSTYGVSATEEASTNASSEASSAEGTNENSSSAATTDMTDVTGSSESSTGASQVIYEEVPGDSSGALKSLDEYVVDPDDAEHYKIPDVPAVYGPPNANW